MQTAFANMGSAGEPALAAFQIPYASTPWGQSLGWTEAKPMNFVQVGRLLSLALHTHSELFVDQLVVVLLLHLVLLLLLVVLQLLLLQVQLGAEEDLTLRLCLRMQLLKSRQWRESLLVKKLPSCVLQQRPLQKFQEKQLKMQMTQEIQQRLMIKSANQVNGSCTMQTQKPWM